MPSTEQGPSSGAPGPGDRQPFPRDPRQRPGQGRAVWAWRSRSRAATGQTLHGLGARAPAPNLRCLKWPHADPGPLPGGRSLQRLSTPLGRPSARPPPVGLSASVLPPPSPPGPYAPSKADLRPISPQCSLDTPTVIAKTVQGWTYMPALSRPVLPRAHSDRLTPVCILQVPSNPSENRTSGGWGGAPRHKGGPLLGLSRWGQPCSPRLEGPSSPEAQPETLQAEQ